MSKKSPSMDMVPELSGMPPIDRWVGRNLRRATNAVFHDFVQRFSVHDIRPALFSVLTVIENNPGSSGAKLSELLAVPPANMVLTLRELENRGLVERKADPTNGRARVTHLSKAGKKLMPKLHAIHAQHEASLDSLMTDEERDVLVGLLQRIWKERAGEIAGDDLS